MWKTEKHFDLVEFDDSELCVKSRLVNKEREFAVFPIDKRRLFLSITEIRQIYTYLKEHLIEFTTEDQHLFDITSELLREIKSLRLKAPLKREGITQVTDEVFGHWVELYITWWSNDETTNKYLSYRSSIKHRRREVLDEVNDKPPDKGAARKSRKDYERFSIHFHGAANSSKMLCNDRRAKGWNIPKLEEFIVYANRYSGHTPFSIRDKITKMASILNAIRNEKYIRDRHIKLWHIFYEIKANHSDFITSFRDWRRKRISRNKSLK